MGVIGYKCNRHDIEQGNFASVMLRRMVEGMTGEISDAKYELAARAAADKLGLKFSDGRIDLRHMSAGTLSYISSHIADAVVVGQPQKAGAVL